MPYTKTNWTETTPITPDALNNLEAQHEQALNDTAIGRVINQDLDGEGGKYLEFGSGALIQWGYSGTLTVNTGATVTYNFNFPKPFLNTPNLTYSLFSSDVEGLYTVASGISALNKTSASITLINKGTAIVYVAVNWEAKAL